MKHRPKHIAEYVLLRVLAPALNLLPYRAALAVGWGVAWLGFHIVRFRAAAARARIREIFGGRFDEREIGRIAWLSWRNFVFSAVELLRLGVSSTAWVKSVVDMGDNAQKVLAELKPGRGAIIATMHMGSWEMSALAGLAYNLPLFSLAAKQKNALVDDYMNRMRAKTGFETILRGPSALKNIIRKLREGKVLAILSDVRSPTPGLSVRFLGKTANIGGGMGLIARHTGAPVFPCLIVRLGWDRHRYWVGAPIWPDPSLDKQADRLRITQAVFDVFDRRIREEPDQWFWFNKRWLFDPLATDEPGGDQVADVAEETPEGAKP